jgi:hypothetical protein
MMKRSAAAAFQDKGIAGSLPRHQNNGVDSTAMSTVGKKPPRRRKHQDFAILLLLLMLLSTLSVRPVHQWAEDTFSPVTYILPERPMPMFGPADDLSAGKSCVWEKQRWRCQQCSSAGVCRHLKRRGICRPFPRQSWDDPHPRFASYHDPAAAAPDVSRALGHFGSKAIHRTYYVQPVCSVMNKECFDLTRCQTTTEGGPLTVYVQHAGPHAWLDPAIALLPGLWKRVDDHRSACLVVVTKHEYRSARELFSADHWGNRRGRNHLIYKWRHGNQDLPWPEHNMDMAALASTGMSQGSVRLRYDVPLPLTPVWKRPVPFTNVPTGRRRWLLSFKATIHDTLQPYFQHRWLALEYWENADDILVDVQCFHRTWTHKKVQRHAYQLPADMYGDILLNSTFGFTPGGSAASSFRFAEILSAGGVPVVTHDFVPPLHPEIDWSDCLVTVSEARIVDLPRIVREFTDQEILSRQRECARLYLTVMGDKEVAPNQWRLDDATLLAKTLQVWSIRIRHALHLATNLEELNEKKQH